MNLFVLALVFLQPVMDEPGPARFVATEVDAPVTWAVDGRVVGVTVNREPLRTWLDAGVHNVTAQAEGGDWLAMVRPEPSAPAAVAVPAWTARAPGDQYAPNAAIAPPGAIVACLVAVGLAAWIVRR